MDWVLAIFKLGQGAPRSYRLREGDAASEIARHSGTCSLCHTPFEIGDWPGKTDGNAIPEPATASAEASIPVAKRFSGRLGCKRILITTSTALGSLSLKGTNLKEISAHGRRTRIGGTAFFWYVPAHSEIGALRFSKWLRHKPLPPEAFAP